MMKIFTRTISKEVMLAIFGILLGFFMIFVTFDGLEEAKNLGEKNYDFMTLIKVVFLRSPDSIYRLIPICALIGAVVALSNIAARSELVAWRAYGLTVRRLIITLIAIGSFIAALATWLGDKGIATAEIAAISIKNEALGEDVFFKDKSGFWGKTQRSDGGMKMINVRNLVKGELRDVRIYDVDAQFNLQQIEKANVAVPIDDQGKWKLSQVQQLVVQVDKNGAVTHHQMNEVATLDSDWGANNMAAILEVRQSLFNLSIFQILDRIQSLKANNQSYRDYELALWQKLSYPFSIVVMILLAAPFAFMQTRKGGVGARIFMGIMLGMLFFLITGLTQYLGPLVNWPAWLLSFAPVIVFFMVAMFWTKRVTKVS